MKRYTLPFLIVFAGCGHDSKSERSSPAPTPTDLPDSPLALNCPQGQRPSADKKLCEDSPELAEMRQTLKERQDHVKAMKARFEEGQSSLTSIAATLEKTVKSWDEGWLALERDFDKLTLTAVIAQQSELNNSLRSIEADQANFTNWASTLRQQIYAPGILPSAMELDSILKDAFVQVVKDGNELRDRSVQLENSVLGITKPLNTLSVDRNSALDTRIQLRRAREL